MNTFYETKILDHLGLVAGMFDKLQIGKTIDRSIEQDFDARNVSIGTLVKALVINGLGFANSRLYLIPDFFKNKPTELLLGEGILHEHLNDDATGRALDSIHAFGTTSLYSSIATIACNKLNPYNTLEKKFVHIDSTSFHVDGKYNSSDEKIENIIHLVKGYSRDHRPELNQVMLNLIVENQANIPISMKALDGNSNDQKVFGEIIKKHVNSLRNHHNFDYIVGDAALYSRKNLEILRDCSLAENTPLFWITRVPMSLRSSKDLVQSVSKEQMTKIDENYSYLEICSSYADIRQRWLLVFSEAAYNKEIKTVEKKIGNGVIAETKAFNELCKQEFSCEKDASQAISKLMKKINYIEINDSEVIELGKFNKKGRPSKNQEPDELVYRVTGKVRRNEATVTSLKKKCGFFILATNDLNDERLSCPDILRGYKNQGRVERGFRFLKDPSFLSSSIFLEKPERIEALLMVMTICLMVYAALEYDIRNELKEQNKYFPNQLKKNVQNPTAKWVIYSFHGIHILTNPEAHLQSIINYEPLHKKILKLLDHHFQKYYTTKPKKM
jgi:transposase